MKRWNKAGVYFSAEESLGGGDVEHQVTFTLITRIILRRIGQSQSLEVTTAGTLLDATVHWEI